MICTSGIRRHPNRISLRFRRVHQDSCWIFSNMNPAGILYPAQSEECLLFLYKCDIVSTERRNNMGSKDATKIHRQNETGYKEIVLYVLFLRLSRRNYGNAGY